MVVEPQATTTRQKKLRRRISQPLLGAQHSIAKISTAYIGVKAANLQTLQPAKSKERPSMELKTITHTLVDQLRKQTSINKKLIKHQCQSKNIVGDFQRQELCKEIARLTTLQKEQLEVFSGEIDSWLTFSQGRKRQVSPPQENKFATLPATFSST